MSIDNMLAAIEEAEDEKEVLTVITTHLTPQNGFHVSGIPPHPGVSAGLFAIDLNAPSVDAIYVHREGYSRFRDLEEACEFLSLFIPKADIERALGEVGA